MVVYVETCTEAVNPPSTSTTVTHTQLWNGIMHRMHNSHLMVPYIKSVKILRESDEELVLVQALEQSSTSGNEVRERLVEYKLFAPSKFEAHYKDQSYTVCCTGIISEGSGGDADLFWSLAWDWSTKGMGEDSAEHREEMKKHHRHTFEQVLENTRKMVRNGEL